MKNGRTFRRRQRHLLADNLETPTQVTFLGRKLNFCWLNFRLDLHQVVCNSRLQSADFFSWKSWAASFIQETAQCVTDAQETGRTDRWIEGDGRIMAPFSPCFLLTFLAVKGNGDLLPMLFLPTWVVWYRHHQDISRCWPLSFSLPSIIHGIPLSRRTQKRPAAAASLKGGPCVIVTKMLEILRLRLHLLLRIDLDKTCSPVGAEKNGNVCFSCLFTCWLFVYREKHPLTLEPANVWPKNLHLNGKFVQ